MTHLPPDPKFRALLAAALVAGGCTGKSAKPLDAEEPAPAERPAEGPEELGDAGPQGEPACLRQPAPAFAEALRLPAPVDALAVASWWRAGRPPELQVSPLMGELCGKAAEPDACRAQLEEAQQALVDGEGHLRSQCGQAGCQSFAWVWTRGGTVGTLTDLEALKAFLGPIDTAADASARVWASTYTVSGCGVEQVGEGWQVTAWRRVADCPVQYDAYEVRVTREGVLTERAHRPGQPTGVCIGRLPPGLQSAGPAGSGIGPWLARSAHLEAASVHAFLQLQAELVHHGAPEALQRAAAACAADEVRHAAQVGALARARGAAVVAPEVVHTEIRSLAEIAADNAAEGCGREAWGALLGLWQAAHAADGDVREVMAAVAADEIRHAEFSFALDAWLQERLTAQQQAEVARIRRRARRRLRREARRALPPATRRALGMPTASEAARLWASFVEA